MKVDDVYDPTNIFGRQHRVISAANSFHFAAQNVGRELRNCAGFLEATSVRVLAWWSRERGQLVCSFQRVTSIQT